MGWTPMTLSHIYTGLHLLNSSNASNCDKLRIYLPGYAFLPTYCSLPGLLNAGHPTVGATYHVTAA